MRRIGRVWLCAVFALAAAGCGGGDGAVIGIGNSGNRFGMEELEDVAEALAESPATPRVTDSMVRLVFDAILERAREGDPQAAMIVLLVAEEQREEAEEG